jgi:ectoine hydroxylase-related dioxygenase (phytanoyl-CoA dioxygenase family)
MFAFFGKKRLSKRQRAFWDQNGYLILRGALSNREIDAILGVVDRQWREREGNDHVIDILSGEHSGRDFPMHAVSGSFRNDVYKLNSLFARLPEVRAICYNKVVKAALSDLLGGEPLICNTLNFERGSQQPYHIDTWYMPPPVDNMMVAASFALEDVDSHNGPLTYYPGSQLIPGYRFSNGGLIMINEEAPSCGAYLWQEVKNRGLVAEDFTGRKGDVFLWHAQLLHGGKPISDFGRTRNSLVVHYWRRQDVPEEQVRADASGAYLSRTLRGEISF